MSEDKDGRSKIASKEKQRELQDLLDQEDLLSDKERKERDKLDQSIFRREMRKFLKSLGDNDDDDDDVSR